MDEIEQLKLLDVISKTSLQTLQDSFADATGLTLVALDSTGELTKWSHTSEMTSSFAKRMPDEYTKCIEKACEDARARGHAVIYDTFLGFSEFVVPISLKGRVLGFFNGGQVLTEKPNESVVRKFASTYGFNAAPVMEMLSKLEIVPESRLSAAAELLMNLVGNELEREYQHMLAAQRGKTAREGLEGDDLDDDSIRGKINSAVEFVSNVERGCERIKDAVSESTRAVDSTDSIVKTIENASTQLTLIGFNASIEAKRAGAAGAGFNVIAQEVRTLAEKNTKQAGEIEHTLNGIKKSMGDINNQIRGLYSDIEKIVDAINELSIAIMDYEQKEE